MHGKLGQFRANSVDVDRFRPTPGDVGHVCSDVDAKMVDSGAKLDTYGEITQFCGESVQFGAKLAISVSNSTKFARSWSSAAISAIVGRSSGASATDVWRNWPILGRVRQMLDDIRQAWDDFGLLAAALVFPSKVVSSRAAASRPLRCEFGRVWREFGQVRAKLAISAAMSASLGHIRF